jgi:hypothetical protein
MKHIALNPSQTRPSRIPLISALLLLTITLTACGGGGTPAPETPATVVKPEMRCAP